MDSSLPDNFFNDENSTDQFPSSTSQQLNTSSSQAQLSMNAQLATNLELLRSMGFSDDDEIRQALTISKNDINEAVAILTNEKLPKISTLVGGKSSDTSGTNATTSTNTGGNEVVMNSDSNSDSPSSNDMNNNGGSKETNSNEAFKSTTDSTNPLIFPYECLSLLESSVFTDNWSIPYKKDEWLDRLLTSTIAHIKEGTADSDQNCRRFLEKVLPEVYRKLLDTAPVNRWNNEIQTGVMNMTMLGVELIAARLEQLTPLHIVPDVLLETINLIFSPHCVFHTKNSTRQWDNHFYLDAINGAQNLFTKELDSYGWLLNLINDFGLNKGFESIKTHMENTSDLNELNLLLKPIATCVRYLNPVIFKPMLEGILRKIIELISSLANDDFKDKNVGRVFDLLVTVKKIAIELFTNDIEEFHKLHLDTVVNMLKYSHFNSKMNSLKEICKLIEAAKNDHCPSIISDRYLAEWIVNNQILSLAVEGNIDQSQYCEKIKTIVEFIGDRITNQEISALWNMQFNKSLSIVENLYIIIGIAATKFNPEHEQLDFLIGQIIQTWNDSNFKLHDKLVGLLRIIGRDSRSNKTYTRILEALWELKNRPGLSRPLLLLIFSEHLNVLNGGRMPRDQAKSAYIKRCCEDMKRAPGTTISIAALRYIYDILNSYQKNTSKQLKEIVSEIVQPLMKQFCTSLSKCHANAVEKARQLGITFDQNVLVDDIFTHEEVVRFHLLVLKFLLTEGNLYLNLNRACEIWDILITNEAACTWDRQTGFEWFIESWVDLKDESKADIFKNQILTLKPSHLTLRGYECFRLYFLRVNEFEQRVQCRFNADPDNYHVEKLDLCGLNYLWDIILQVEDEQLAELATKFLLDISYEKVSHKIKRELVQLHQRFINECYNRLENFLIALDTNPISNLLLSGFRIAALSTGMSDMAFAPLAPRALIYKCIARLLMIAEKYIVTVEEGLAFSRTCLPHYLSFRGESFFLNVIVSHSNDTTKTTHLEIPVCSNETLGELRLRIASQLNVLPSSVLIYGPPEQNPSTSTNNKDNSCIFISSTNTTNNNNNNNNNGSSTKLLNQADYKLLSSLNIDGMHPIHVKLASTYPPTTSSSTTQKTFTDFYSSVRIDSEHEKTLPSVLIANNSFAFDMFTRLDDLEQTEIRTRVRNILRLIPTNPKLVEAFDLVVLKRCETSTASVAAAATPTLVKSPSTSSMNIPPSQPILSQTTAASSQSNPCTPTISTLGSSNFLLNNPFLSRSRNAASTASEKPVQISLKEYFEKSQVPLNRILYNLEALSGRLMPPHSVSSDHSKADSFQQDFLQANGLKVLISLLNLESSGKIEVNSDEYETKEDIYLLLLQLLHLLIFGSYYPFNQSHVHTSHNKRPSSEPISCCSSAPKKTVTQSMMDDHLMQQQQQQQQPQSPSPLATAFTPPNFSGSLPHTSLNTTFALATTLNEPTNLVEKMSLNEINELVAQLLTLFWSAAAGNIQLSSSSTKTMSGSTATLTDEIITSGSAVDMQLSSCSLTTATSSQQTTTEETINPVKASASEDMVIVHDMDAMLDDINVADEFPKVGLIDANFNQSLTSARKEVKFFLPEHNRLSTGSNMSTGSLESSSNTASTVNQFSPQHVPHSRADSGDTSVLQPGCCIRQKKEIKVKDIKIAAKAIEIISCFVQYRKDCLPGLMSMKLFNECILDTLTGSISSEIRTHMERFLLKLVQTDPSVKTQLMQVIIRARLPLWLNTTLTRSSNQRLIAQSTQYFQLRCSLMENLSLDEQSAYGIDLSKMINDELNWLAHFAPTKSLKHIDSVLLTGHLCLLKSLLTCATAPKADVGDECVNQLIRIYLFPASYTLSFGLGNTNSVDEVNMEPVCSSEESRQAAYRLLVELSRNCLKNYRTICHQLIRLHHTYNQALASSEWNIVPPQVTPRADCGFVGLKNGGATCYMNAVLQQINAIPGLNDYVLSINDEDEPNEIMSSEAAVSNKEDKSMATSDSNNEITASSTDNTANRVVSKQGDRASSVFWQLQNVFAHLKESKLEYYVPEPFWKAFRMLGQEINLREQQDAFDFFISLKDQIDDHLKKIKREAIFTNIFEGAFSNQLICTDCPHRYEREEVFLGLNLPIKSGNLQESLLQFFKDELLDGDNAYNCEKCNEKRSAIKRTCIKKLPKYLCIQLKRFDYDWESNRALKFDDYFQFPRSLNVAPYTYDSINSKTGTTTTTDQPTDKSASSSASSSNEQQQQKEIMYDLVGIIVHSGQANAGHYYSYIKTSSYQSSTSSKRAVRSRRRCAGSGTEAATAGDECGLPMPLGDDYGPFNAEHEELLQLEQLNQSIDENLYANMCNQVRLAKEEKWFKFNDTAVEEINLTDQVLTEECFGGTFTASSEFKMLPEERIRYWNAYMLFYRESNYSLTLNREEQSRRQQQVNKFKSQRREGSNTNTALSNTDSLSQLAELISKGDEKGIFRRMGFVPEIEQIVKAENLEFCRNRAIYEPNYLNFIFNMSRVFKELDLLGENRYHDSEMFAFEATNLSLEFLYNTYFKIGKKLRTDLNKWLDLLKDLLFYSKESAQCMLNFVVMRESNSSFIRHYLLECPILEIREACQQLFEHCLTSLVVKYEFQPLDSPKIASLITSLVQLLDKAVIDLSKNSHEYFKLLYVYANMSKSTAQQLISLSIFNKLFCFLLGNPAPVKSEESSNNRRWSSQQMKEFGIVHELIATLVLQCNILSRRTCEMDEPMTPTSASEMNTPVPTPMSTEVTENDQLKRLDEIAEPETSTSLLASRLGFVDSTAKSSGEKSTRLFFSPPSASDDLIPIPQEMQIYLFGALSSRYLKELVFAFEQINQSSLSKSLQMIQSCCFCNESFSASIIHQILLSINTLSSNDTKQALYLLNSIILIEDPLQLKRLQLTLDGYKDENTVYNGLLTIVRQNQSSDAKKSYHCVKFIVTLANQSSPCREYLLKTATNWEWSVNWLRQKMTESISGYMNWNQSKFHSNEDAEIRTFQRTKSAQRTLDDATALLRSTDIDI